MKSPGKVMVDIKLPQKVLIVAEDLGTVSELAAFLERQGIVVLQAKDLEGTLYLINNNSFEIAITPLEMSEISGLPFLQKLQEVASQEENNRLGIIVRTASSLVEPGVQALLKELGGIEVVASNTEPLQMLPFLVRAKRRRDSELNFAQLTIKVLDFYEKSADLDKVVDAVQKIMPKLGKNGPLFLVQVYEEMGEYTRALRLLSSLIENDSGEKDLKLLDAYGRIFFKLGQLTEAETYLEMVDALAPLHIKRTGNLVGTYMGLNKPEKTVSKMRTLLSFYPEVKSFRFDLVDRLLKAGFSAEAVDFCREVATGYDVVQYYNNQGVIDARAQRFPEAISGYRKALTFYPDHEESYRIHFNLALSLINQREKGYVKEAIRALEDASRIRSDFDKATNLLATLKHQERGV